MLCELKKGWSHSGAGRGWGLAWAGDCVLRSSVPVHPLSFRTRCVTRLPAHHKHVNEATRCESTWWGEVVSLHHIVPETPFDPRVTAPPHTRVR